MKKIILFNPPLYFSQGNSHAIDVSVPPLGLLYLASYVNKNSKIFKASVVDIAAEKLSLDEIKKKVSRVNPFVVGITSMTPQLQGTVELAEFLKIHFGGKFKIFIGGPHISADKDFIDRFSAFFDYAVTGEGEITFLKSLNKLVEGKRVPRIQNGEIPLSLDLLPFPDKRLIRREAYCSHESMMFSRGCPYQCYYCSRPSISRITRYRSAENLVKEVKLVYKYCKGKIDFQDDTFTLNRGRVEEFCKRVIDEKLNLQWRCNTRIDLVDEALLKIMKQAGCDLIHFGIEAANERIRRDVVRKGDFKNKDIYKIIKLCRKYGIKFAGYFIIGHCGEGKRELNQTKEMILKSGIDLVGLSLPLPFPGSNLYKIAESQNKISTKLIDDFALKKLGEGYSGIYPVFVSDKVSKDFVFSLMKEINRKFYITPKMIWRRLREDVSSFSRLKQDVSDLRSLVFKGMSSRKPYDIVKRVK